MTERTADAETPVASPSGPGSDIPVDFVPVGGIDHVRREVAITMRDGVQLHTVILIPAGAARAPMMLDRTPYGAKKVTRLTGSQRATMAMYAFHSELLQAGYIVVVQDVRGKYQSEGDYVLNRPLAAEPDRTGTDHSTDTWDTISWLVANVPESNGRVGTIGISYDGFTCLMSLVDPHPALQAAVPINPMVDNWIGDDWFHNGAFRQTITAQYSYVQTTSKSSELQWPVRHHDEYDRWLEAGSAGAMAESIGLDRLPFWRRVAAHPAYDDYWQSQAVDRILAGRPLTVPTLHVHSQWDAEDSYGSLAAYLAMETADVGNDRNFLAIGPWSHPGVGFDDGGTLGPLKFGSDTARWFRRQVMLPFLDRHLREQVRPREIAPVTAFETGTNVWHEYERWPPTSRTQSVYLAANAKLAFEEQAARDRGGFEEYVSDPAKPVTYTPRPIRPKGAAGSNWDAWLVEDQRFANDRPDVLSYRSAILTAPLRLAGQPVMHLYAATTGQDADWIVKLIDVYPDEVPGDATMGSYQLPIAMEILRGRYRDDPAHPTPIPPGETLRYTIRLPHVSHAYLPGHRIMVQIQSTWFPLYDRNPQSWVDNIFFAAPTDFVKATHRVFHGGRTASFLELPLAD